MTPEIVEQMLATARAGKTVAYFGTHKSISEVFPMVIDTAGQAL